MMRYCKMPANPFESLKITADSVRLSDEIISKCDKVNLFPQKRFNRFVEDIQRMGYQVRMMKLTGNWVGPVIIVKAGELNKTREGISVPVKTAIRIKDKEWVVFPV